MMFWYEVSGSSCFKIDEPTSRKLCRESRISAKDGRLYRQVIREAIREIYLDSRDRRDSRPVSCLRRLQTVIHSILQVSVASLTDRRLSPRTSGASPARTLDRTARRSSAVNTSRQRSTSLSAERSASLR